MFQPPKREYRDKRTARGWLYEYLRKMGPTKKSDVLIAAAKEGFEREAMEKAYSRGRGDFHGEIGGFQGDATWRLRMEATTLSIDLSDVKETEEL